MRKAFFLQKLQQEVSLTDEEIRRLAFMQDQFKILFALADYKASRPSVEFADIGTMKSAVLTASDSNRPLAAGVGETYTLATSDLLREFSSELLQESTKRLRSAQKLVASLNTAIVKVKSIYPKVGAEEAIWEFFETANLAGYSDLYDASRRNLEVRNYEKGGKHVSSLIRLGRGKAYFLAARETSKEAQKALLELIIKSISAQYKKDLIERKKSNSSLLSAIGRAAHILDQMRAGSSLAGARILPDSHEEVVSLGSQIYIWAKGLGFTVKKVGEPTPIRPDFVYVISLVGNGETWARFEVSAKEEEGEGEMLVEVFGGRGKRGSYTNRKHFEYKGDTANHSSLQSWVVEKAKALLS